MRVLWKVCGVVACLLIIISRDCTGFDFGHGHDAKCSNEGEPVSVEAATNGSLKDSPCLSCFCQKGIIVCRQEVCASLKTCPVAVQPSESVCCAECRTCQYLGETKRHDQQWGSSQDACRTLTCKAGVVTAARMQCVTPCANPRPMVGYCCPVCPIPDSSSSGSIPMDPCLQCTTDRQGRWMHCFRTACPVLDCPLHQQYTSSERCCPECAQTRYEKVLEPFWQTGGLVDGSCYFQNTTYSNLQSFRPDDCSMCKCEDALVMCKRFVCPDMDCPKQRLYFRPGLCCPFCRDKDPLPCPYSMHGLTEMHKSGSTWSPDVCTNCSCANGETDCDRIECEHPYRCPRGYRRRQIPGQCCHVCEQKETTCTVFGDPHYQTFDGYNFSFQGTCPYVLTQECALRGDKPGFEVVAHNGPWGNRHRAAWTRRLTVRLQLPGQDKATRISLLQRQRVKVNGRRVSLPYIQLETPIFRIRRDKDRNAVIMSITSAGLKVLWDGHSYAEITLDADKWRGSVCGLCGNNDGLADNDDVPRFGAARANSVEEFAQSWRWDPRQDGGGIHRCVSRHDRQYHNRRKLGTRVLQQLHQLRMQSLLPAVLFNNHKTNTLLDLVSVRSMKDQDSLIYGPTDRLDKKAINSGRKSGKIPRRTKSAGGYRNGTNYQNSSASISSAEHIVTYPQQNTSNMDNAMITSTDSEQSPPDRRKSAPLRLIDLISRYQNAPELLVGEQMIRRAKKRRRKSKHNKMADNGGKPKRRGRKRGRRGSLRKMCGGSAKWRTRRNSIDQCRLIKSQLFKPCHDKVTPGRYFRWCVEDACACPSTGRCFCDSLHAYGRDCERHDVLVDWQPKSQCSKDLGCPVEGAEFSSCACTKTCLSGLSALSDCDSKTCLPGCQCPKGTVEHKSKCIPIDHCPK